MERKRILTGIRPHRGAPPWPLRRGLGELAAPPARVRVLLPHRRLSGAGRPRRRRRRHPPVGDRRGHGLARRRPRPQGQRLRHSELRARARRADDAAQHDHPAGAPPAQPDAQVGVGARRAGDLGALRRLLHLPRQPDRRHPAAQGAPRARGRGPDAAHRDDPRDRPQVQPTVRRGLPRAQGPHRPRPPARRHRQPGKDEQEPQQLHLPQGRRRHRRQDGPKHVHRPHAPPRHRPRPRGGQPRLHVPRRLQPRHRGGRGPEGPLPPGGRRRRRGQAEADRRAERLLGADSRAPRPLRAAPDEVHEALLDGTRRAKAVAEQTMDEVRSAMGISSYTGAGAQ